MKTEAISGCIIGTAIGDALGLPYEGLSPIRAKRLFKAVDCYHFLFNHGMVSDDTEHTCMVAEALIASGGNVDIFIKSIAQRFRYWLLSLPAGIGFATLRSILKLWLGFSPSKSGVFSAGSGPAMRSAILGVCYGSDDAKLKELVRAATVITHTDPKAYWGALAVALAAHENCAADKIDGIKYYHRLANLLDSESAAEFLNLMKQAVDSASKGRNIREFVKSLNLRNGITGYTYHTVPAVIHTWLSNPSDFKRAVMEMITCGGDTDTTAAIVGGIVGAGVGPAGIPQKWLINLWEWPRTINWMRQLGGQLEGVLRAKCGAEPPRLPWMGILLRNLLFVILVLLHALRRLLPPY
ncbi:MAG: ADP-ribosylglycohydrolase family protein [Deltaproteobacteria bacterium]|nr:MAG: ADP-ribosylglycohydrolase family protein [Deltaproteobacteria bacterium]